MTVWSEIGVEFEAIFWPSCRDFMPYFCSVSFFDASVISFWRVFSLIGEEDIIGFTPLYF